MNCPTHSGPLGKWLLLSGSLCFFSGLLGCEANPTSRSADPVDTMGTSISFLALGDSYTIGEGVAAPDRWPMLLAAQARKAGIPLEDPRIIARTGWTTGELSAAIDAAHPLGPYGLVSLLIGVNNQYRGMPLKRYRGEFDSLLARAIGFAGGRPEKVLVLSIPDWGASFYGRNFDTEMIAMEIDAFNAANREISLAKGVRYVDVTQASREASGDESGFAPDGLHYSGLMHGQWAGLALDAMTAFPAAPRVTYAFTGCFPKKTGTPR